MSMNLKFAPHINPDDVIGVECKHAVRVQSAYKRPDGIRDDLVFVKEVIHLKDGTKVPSRRLKKNPLRDFYITREGYRKHQEKKDWEKIERLQRFECTQSELPHRVKKALKLHTPTLNMRELGNSPYLYGSDITVTATIKHAYMEAYPDAVSVNSVCGYDIETDVLHGTDDPIMISLTMKEKVYHLALRRAVAHVPNYEEQWLSAFHDLAADTVKRRNLIDVKVEVCETVLDLITRSIQVAHEWMPDILAIFNIDFDIPRIMDTITKYGGNAGDIFSDPSVPPAFRYAKYVQGTDKKVTASGDESSLLWYDRWHTLVCPASFYVIDQACVFRAIRFGGGKEPAMSLDALLRKYAKSSKFVYAPTAHLKGLKYHQVMQKDHVVPYGVYSALDCTGIEDLDEVPKVRDLASTMSSQVGWSDYDRFKSQPRRTCDKLHYFCLEHGHVIASTPKVIETKFDRAVSGIDGWIITLDTHTKVVNGLKVLEEDPNAVTLLHTAVYDLDITGAYPTGEDDMNTSKSTTKAEISQIQGVTEEVRRNAGMNLTGGTINALEICCSVLKAPTFDMLCKAFEAEKGISKPTMQNH